MPAIMASPLVKATRSCGAGPCAAVTPTGWGFGASSEETVDVLAAKTRSMAAANLKMLGPRFGWEPCPGRIFPQLREQCITFRHGNEQVTRIMARPSVTGPVRCAENSSFRLPRRPFSAVAAGGLAFVIPPWRHNEWSERRDLNPRPPVPQTGALTRLRHAPIPIFEAFYLGGAEHSGGPSRQQARN